MSLHIHSDRRGPLWMVNSRNNSKFPTPGNSFWPSREPGVSLKVAHVFALSLSARMIRGEYIMHYAQKTSEMNHEKIQLLLSSDFIQLYWLFSRDPYRKKQCKGLLWSKHNWVVLSPIYPQQPGALFSLLPCHQGIRFGQMIDFIEGFGVHFFKTVDHPNFQSFSKDWLDKNTHDTFSTKLELTEGTRWVPTNYKYL